jgi:hypothetical protein
MFFYLGEFIKGCQKLLPGQPPSWTAPTTPFTKSLLLLFNIAALSCMKYRPYEKRLLGNH